MSKRKRRGYKQLVSKREQISRLITEASTSPQLSQLGKASITPALDPAKPRAALPESVRLSTTARSTTGELWRTLISSAVVVAILVGLIVIDQRSEILTQFGKKLYTGLELND